MNSIWVKLISVAYFLLLPSAASLSLTLEHSLNGGRSFQQVRSIALHPSAGILTLKADGFKTTEQDEQNFLELIRKNEFYHLRIRLNDSEFLESSIPVCQLVSSSMKAKLVVSVNDRGFPIAIHLTTPVFECLANKASIPIASLSFTLDVQRPIAGASPETIRYLQRLEKQREEMARAEHGDNRSFFAKYWTYILPAVILFLVISSIQEAGSGGGGATGR